MIMHYSWGWEPQASRAGTSTCIQDIIVQLMVDYLDQESLANQNMSEQGTLKSKQDYGLFLVFRWWIPTFWCLVIKFSGTCWLYFSNCPHRQRYQKDTKGWFSDPATVLEWPANIWQLTFQRIWKVFRMEMRETRPNSADDLSYQSSLGFHNIYVKPQADCHKTTSH